VERHLARGQKFFKAEEYNKAEIEFLNVVRLEQTNAVALRDLGLTYYQQGRWLRSYAFLQKASEASTESDEVRLRRAAILMGLGGLKDARTHAEAILSHDAANEEALMLLAETAVSTNDILAVRRQLEVSRPQAQNKAGFHVALGIVELRQGRTNDASASFQRALSLDPKSGPAHLALGNLAVLALDNDQAASHFKKATELAPVRSPRRLQYADFKFRSGDLTAAKTFLEDTVKQASDYVPAYTRLGDIALSERRFDDAAALATKILILDPGNYDGMLLSARVGVGKGDSRGALADFERLATTYPRLASVHYHLAVAHLLNASPGKAGAALQQALALDPKHMDSTLLLAELNIRQNNAASAIASLKRLVQEQPQVFQAHLALARAYRVANQPDSAAQVYETLTKAFPRNPQSHFARGQMLLAEGKKEAARQKFERTVELSPDFLPAIEELANLDIASGNSPAAQQRIENAVARNPKAPGLHVAAARIHLAQKKYTAAEEALSRAISLDPNYDAAFLTLARVYVESNRHQAAIEKLNTVVSRSTNNVPALLQLGILHQQLKNHEATRDAYERLLAVSPRHVFALNNLAYLYSENLNNVDRAYNLARQARDLRPDDPTVADTFGWVLFRRGDYHGALAALRESASKLPQSAEIQFHLGMTHYMLADEKPARAALERALSAGDFSGRDEAQAKLALLSKSSAEPVSLAALEKQVEANPQDPILLTRLAALYEQSGAFDKAAAAYEKGIRQNPRNVSAMLKLTELYAGPLRDSARALQVARTARAAAPDDRGVAQVLGHLAFQSGDFKWSLGLLEEAARGIQAQPELLYDLAWARYSAGRVTDAVAAMNQALASGPTFTNATDARRFVEMNALALLPDKTNATKIDSILKEDRNYPPALLASATIQQRAGNAPLAREQYQAILKRFPDFAPAHKGLATLLCKSPSDVDVAFQHATKAREAFPNDADVARALGIIAFQRKDYARASQLLKEMSQTNPADAEGLYYLGIAQFRLNEKTESRQTLRRALSLDGNAPFASEAQRIIAELN
jgi:tetratricopeptide (TPR) repeat protein